jgi:hypothetical protein
MNRQLLTGRHIHGISLRLLKHLATARGLPFHGWNKRAGQKPALVFLNS